MTYKIPAVNFPVLQDKIAKLNRRSVKLNCSPLELHVIQEVKKVTENSYGLRYKEKFYEVEIIGDTPRLEGWQLLAIVEKQPNGENIVRTVPGCEVPSTYRTTDSHCDHCNTNRYRREVFILGHEDGRIIQVGRSCIKDFLSHPDASLMASRAEYVLSAEDVVRGHCSGRVEPSCYIEEFLGMVATCIRYFGWVGRGQAEEKPRLYSTATLAWELIMLRSDVKVKKFIAENHIIAKGKDTRLAEEAHRWGRGLIDGSDYIYNLGVACRQDLVTYKTAGLVASVVSSYQRNLNREEKRKKIIRKHVGTVGKREDFEVTVKRLRYFESEWGTRTMCLFEDADNNHIMWWASKELDKIEEGDSVTLRATVKEHTEYHGTPQTLVTRGKIMEETV